MVKKNISLIIGVIVIVACLAVAAYTLSGSVTVYKTVSEISLGGSDVIGKPYNINGTVVNGSIDWDKDDMVLTFKLTDEKEIINVKYPKPAPNNFEDGRTVVVYGVYTKDRVFEANQILVKCPSKYAPDESYSTNEV